jgi:hypothetical protein
LVTSDGGAVLFDGNRVATANCGFPGCREVDLAATIGADRGTHTVTFRIGNLLCDLLPCSFSPSYEISGNVKVFDSSSVVQETPLTTQTVSLSGHGTVTYQIDVDP